MRLSDQDHAAVTAAVTAAERTTDGEIVTVVAQQSDAYHDVGLHWAVLAMLLALAVMALFPVIPETLYHWVDPWSATVSPTALLTVALVVVAAKFLAVRVLLAWRPLRMMLTPGATKARRVHRRALALFRTAAEKRTVGETGVLLYLSLAEHRAEIIADGAIHSKVAPEAWGHAMASLIAAVRDGRPGDGMAEAVREIGVLLSEHFPKSDGNPNELPDRLIEL